MGLSTVFYYCKQWFTLHLKISRLSQHLTRDKSALVMLPQTNVTLV